MRTPTGREVVTNGSPQEIYEAFRHQRQELRDQLDRLESQRRDIANELQQEPGATPLNAVDKKLLEQRLTAVDDRITTVEKAIADADASVARAAAVPGAVVEVPPTPREGPPEEVFVLAGMFIVIVLLPISIAFARRIWKRSSAAISKLPQEIYDRFARVDQSLDAIAIEVERIGEGQRFLTRMQTEQRAVGAGTAQPIEVAERERERQSRNR